MWSKIESDVTAPSNFMAPGLQPQEDYNLRTEHPGVQAQFCLAIFDSPHLFGSPPSLFVNLARYSESESTSFSGDAFY